jgi:hypothetical protein
MTVVNFRFFWRSFSSVEMHGKTRSVVLTWYLRNWLFNVFTYSCKDVK